MITPIISPLVLIALNEQFSRKYLAAHCSSSGQSPRFRDWFSGSSYHINTISFSGSLYNIFSPAFTLKKNVRRKTITSSESALDISSIV